MGQGYGKVFGPLMSPEVKPLTELHISDIRKAHSVYINLEVQPGVSSPQFAQIFGCLRTADRTKLYDLDDSMDLSLSEAVMMLGSAVRGLSRCTDGAKPSAHEVELFCAELFKKIDMDADDRVTEEEWCLNRFCRRLAFRGTVRSSAAGAHRPTRPSGVRKGARPGGKGKKKLRHVAKRRRSGLPPNAVVMRNVKREVRLLRETFEAIDEDNNQEIDINEFLKTHAIPAGGGPKPVRNRRGSMDDPEQAQGNFSAEQSECGRFNTINVQPARKVIPPTILKMFMQMDEDGDGKITWVEILRVMFASYGKAVVDEIISWPIDEYKKLPRANVEEATPVHIDVSHESDLKQLFEEPKLVYCFGKYVVARNLNDSGDNFVYRGHKYDVGAAAFSPNGYWVASGDAGGFLRLELGQPGARPQVEVQVFAGAIKDLQWDGESKKIVVVGDGKGVVAKCVMWDTGNAAGEMARPFRIMTGSEDFKCAFYKGPPFKLDHTCAEHKNYVNKVAYSPSGDFVASVGSDKKIVLYDGKEGTVAGELKGDGKAHPQGSVYSCAWAPDSSKLLTASADKALHLWDVGAKSLVATKAMGADVADMQMAAVWVHGQAMSVSLSGDVNYLDEALNVTKVVQAPQAPVSAMAVVGSTIVAGCNDGTVFKSTDAKSWTKLDGAVPRSHVRAAHGGKVTAVAAFGGGFATAGFDDTVRFCDGAAYDAEVKVDGQPKGLAAGGDNVAVATTGPRDRTARSASSTRRRWSRCRPSGEITSLAWSPDGSKLAAGDADREIKVYDASAGFAVVVQNLWRFHTARVTALAWSPDSMFLASSSNDESIFYWSLANPQKSAHKYDFTHKDGTTALAFLGGNVVSAGNDACVCLWTV
ncbi:hypothetical protein JL721_2147 [Aureococcus anophagefferens]|nr:hypothetical protein JL721_2147 [Aureococcus anophagefferens]